MEQQQKTPQITFFHPNQLTILAKLNKVHKERVDKSAKYKQNSGKPDSIK